MRTAIIAILLTWAVAMPAVGLEGYNGPEPVADGYGENRPRKNLITKPQSELREFTGKDGKKIRGKIQTYDSSRKIVTITAENGKIKKANLAVFSEADQAYVREWHLIHVFFTKLSCKISPRKDQSCSGVEFLIWRPGEEHIEKIAYDIRLENRSSSDLNDLIADYCIYYELNQLWHRDRIVDEDIMYGMLNIGMLAGGERIQVKTMPLVLPRGGVEYYKDGTEPQVKLLGIWIRVYLPLTGERKAMREFFTPDDLRNHYKWAPRKSPGRLSK